ncbi:hypothetical protein Dda3937_04354 [Dickeya dadantii 3937]|uniref:Uncharacterized protein n=1 Tax=Dickeya dadantii (strain 3937) TaxID=198628 RepID=E0SKD6_DICD3|nr:hypothetical protein Dda3937_04354 [Dickeya dadantii 3937]
MPAEFRCRADKRAAAGHLAGMYVNCAVNQETVGYCYLYPLLYWRSAHSLRFCAIHQLFGTTRLCYSSNQVFIKSGDGCLVSRRNGC